MPRSNDRNQPPPGLRPWHWFVLTAAVPIAHCASRLNLDLWHDEIYTIDVFVQRGPAFIVSDYHLPNNHVLFSLLEWPFYCLSDNNFVLRLPSFLCAIGTLAVVFMLGWRLCGLLGAVFSTAFLGLNQMYLIFAIQVRGYGLSMLLAACLAWLAATPPTAVSWRRFMAVTLLGAAFLYVLPTNALFFLPISVTAVVFASVQRSHAARPSVPNLLREPLAWTSALVLAALCYLPIAKQVLKASESSSPSSWSYLPVIAGNFFRPATHDFVWFGPFLLLGLLAWARRRPAGNPRKWTVPALCGSVISGAFLITGVLRISPFERNYCPMMVFLALAAGWLLAELTDAVPGRWARRVPVEAPAWVVLAAIFVAAGPQLWTYPQRLEVRRNEFNASHAWPESDGWPVADGYYCYYAANYRPSAVVNQLLDERIEQSGYRLCWTDADHLNLWYYFDKAGLPPDYRSPAGDDGRPTFAILPEPPPWNRLAKERKLTQDEIDAFRPLGDFGYYRLYRLETAH